MLAHFSFGDRVRFSTGGGDQKAGVMSDSTRNGNIATDDREHWNVHPGYLIADAPEKTPNIVEGKLNPESPSG